MTESLNVLLIEDNDQHAKIVTRHLARSNHLSLVRKSRLSDGLDSVIEDKIDIILLDLRLPDSNHGESLKKMVESFPAIPVVILSSLEDRDFAKKLVHEGAQDFLCKSQLSEDLLLRAINHARERKQIEEALRIEALRKKCLHDVSELGLTMGSLSGYLNEASRIIAKTLGANNVVVFKHDAEKSTFAIRGGTGDIVPRFKSTTISTNELLPSTKIFKQNKEARVYKSNITPQNNQKLNIPLFLSETGAISGIGVSILGSDHSGPNGILCIFSNIEHIFSSDEIYFVQSLANILAAAIKRHNLEFSLKQKVSDLNNAHRKKDEFLSVLSHELRTPLSVVRGYADLLGSLDPNSEDFDLAIRMIQKNAIAEQKLVEDVIDISRIITGRLKLEMRYISLKAVMQSALETVTLAAMSKNITIEDSTDTLLGEFIGDEDRLRQVFWNLLSNAVKFTPASGKITISATKDDGAFIIQVSDTGKGIAKSDLSKLFNRFWQEDTSTKRTHAGLGLGLSIAKNIIEHHGGTISCTSEGPGKGSNFIVRLPINTSRNLVPDLSTTKAAKVVSNSKVNNHVLLENYNVLLIEDADDIREMLTFYFKSEKANVVSFSTALKAFEYFSEAKPGFVDIIVSDIGLPDIDGFEFMGKVRKLETERNFQRTPSVALSAFAGDNHSAKAKKAGFDIHVAKPVVKDELLKEVLRVLNR